MSPSVIGNVYEDSRWFFGGGAGGGLGMHALSNFWSRRNKCIFWVSSRKTSKYLIIFSKKRIFVEAFCSADIYTQDQPSEPFSLGFQKQKNLYVFIISVILATLSATHILFDAVLHVIYSKTCNWHTPNSSSCYLHHSPLSSSKYWTQHPLLLHTPSTYY